MACGYADGQSQSGWSIAVLDANTFHPLRFFHDIPADDGAIPVRWSPDGKYLLYVQTVNGVSNIWKQPVDGGVATQMTHFKEERIFAFALSPDGTALACLRGTRISDAVLLKSGN